MIWIAGCPRVEVYLILATERRKLSEGNYPAEVGGNGLLGSISLEIHDLDGVGVVCLWGMREIARDGDRHLVAASY